MNGQVVLTEFAKLRRSVVPFATLAVILAAPWGVALFMWILRDPQRAADLGLLGTKANLAGLEATWPAFGGYLVMIAGAGGLVMLGFVVAYLFGREYADGTAKNLLALPVGRSQFAVGKLVVAAAWWLALLVALLAEGFAIGLAMGLPGFSGGIVTTTIGNALACAAAAFLLAPVTALATVWSRSYLAALGITLGALAVGNLVAHTGWAAWFPWSVVILLSGSAGGATLPWTSVLVLVLTFAVGMAGTSLQLRLADNP